jgi:hypothetical protein
MLLAEQLAVLVGADGSPAGPVVAGDDRGGSGRAAGPARPSMDGI